MRPVFELVAVAALASAAAYMAYASRQADGEVAPIDGIKIPPGYRDWRLISVNHLAGAGGKLKQVRAQLGNDIAIKAFREEKLPFPDGAQSLPHCIGMKTRRRKTTSLSQRLSRRGPPGFRPHSPRETMK
jgi:hypothetical protein